MSEEVARKDGATNDDNVQTATVVPSPYIIGPTKRFSSALVEDTPLFSIRPATTSFSALRFLP